MNKKLKIVTIGGGSSYTPELIDGFIKRKDEISIKEIWLVDIKEGEEKLNIVGNLARRMIEAAGLDWELHLTLDRREALKDADFVTTQLRVGQLDARVRDERIPLSHGILGQETNGAGGILKAFRTIPVILDIVEDMKELCPKAWLINFTNPAGMVTEAVLNYGKFDKVIGLCNVPISHVFNEAKLLGKEPDELNFLFGGLNHFHWHRVFDGDEEVTGKIIDLMFEKGLNVVANIANIPFIEEQIRDLGMLPCSYHKYYYLEDNMVKKELEDYKKGSTRAEVVKKVEEELFEIYKDANLKEKPEQLSKRGGAHYSDAACEVITSIYNDKKNIMVVSTKNNGAIRELPEDSVVEVSSVITSDGPRPLSFTKLSISQRGQLQLMKSMEQTVIDAAVTGDYGKALQAFTINPLIPGGELAKDVLDEMLIANEEYLPQFKGAIENLRK